VTSAADIGLTLVRRALEEHITLERAPKLLFEALSQLPPDADLPRTPGALTRFVAGPLANVLHEKLGPDEAGRVLETMTAALSSASIGGTAADATPSEEAAPSDDEDPLWIDIDVDEPVAEASKDPFGEPKATLKVATGGMDGTAVRLMIFSQKTRLARWIRAAFGRERLKVSLSARPDKDVDRVRAFAPSIVIFDGQDADDIRPADVANVLETADETTLIIVWASDQPGGSAASAVFEEHGTTFAPVPRESGFEPMLDYIRARIA